MTMIVVGDAPQYVGEMVEFAGLAGILESAGHEFDGDYKFIVGEQEFIANWTAEMVLLDGEEEDD